MFVNSWMVIHRKVVLYVVKDCERDQCALYYSKYMYMPSKRPHSFQLFLLTCETGCIEKWMVLGIVLLLELLIMP